MCAATEEKLAELKKTSDFFRLMRDSGNYPTMLPSPSSLATFEFGVREQEHLAGIANREVIGMPRDVREQILERARRYEADEVMLAAMAYSLEDKIETFALLSREFAL